MIARLRRIPILHQTYEHGHEPVLAAQRIIDELVDLRDAIKESAEGFAILDFVQGHVATELPVEIARNIVEVLRRDRMVTVGGPMHELVLHWLEHYRRAYSHMIMRVLEDGSDSLPE